MRLLLDIKFLIERNFDISIKERKKFINKIKKENKDGAIKICLFGAGTIGQYLYFTFKRMGITIDTFVDNSKFLWGKTIVENCKCKAPTEILNSELVIITSSYVNEIYEQLENMGYKNIIKHPHDIFYFFNQEIFSLKKETFEANIEQLYSILADEKSKEVLYYKVKAWLCFVNEVNEINYGEIYTDHQYYIDEFMDFTKAIYVDCGAFDGDSLKIYLGNSQRKKTLEKYICYELDRRNAEKIKKFVEVLDKETREKIEIYNYGVSDRDAIIQYESDAQQGANISNKGLLEGRSVFLDEHLKNIPITFLKMDIEGAEVDALKGSKDLIMKYKPILAICLYHRASDLWSIPCYIKSLVPEYKIYLRHHTKTMLETVCYAVYEG